MSSTIERVERGKGQRLRELAGAIGAEVEVDGDVVVAHPGIGVDDGRPDELVALAAPVGCGNRRLAVHGQLADRRHDGVICQPGAVPTAIAVHRVVAANHGRQCRLLADARRQSGKESVG
jgi:hypothetical protein